MFDKLVENIKFLESVERLALDQKNSAVPYGRSDLFRAKMWFLGVVSALKMMGYTIVKDEE